MICVILIITGSGARGGAWVSLQSRKEAGPEGAAAQRASCLKQLLFETAGARFDMRF